MRLRNEFGRLIADRRKWGVVQPPVAGVAFVVTRLAVVLCRDGCDFFSATDLAQRLGTDPIPEPVLMREVRRASAEGRLMGPAWRLPPADLLGEVLRVDEEERARLRLQLIGAHDLPADDRRRARERARKAAARRDAGAKPQGSAKPWEREGISRTAWYRRRSDIAVGTVSGARPLINIGARTKPSRESDIQTFESSASRDGGADETVSPRVTFRLNAAPAAVLTAVAAGAQDIPSVVAAAGHPEAAVKKALGRLVAVGRVRKAGRGRYAPANADPAEEDAEGGPAAQLPTRSPPQAEAIAPETAGRGFAPAPLGTGLAAAPRTAGTGPAHDTAKAEENQTMLRIEGTPEARVLEALSRGPASAGRIAYLTGMQVGQAREVAEVMVAREIVRHLGDGVFSHHVVTASADRPPESRPRLPLDRERAVEAEVARTLWEHETVHLWNLSREIGTTPHAVRCAMRCLDEGGYLERLGIDEYRLSPKGLKLVAAGEFL